MDTDDDSPPHRSLTDDLYCRLDDQVGRLDDDGLRELDQCLSGFDPEQELTRIIEQVAPPAEWLQGDE